MVVTQRLSLLDSRMRRHLPICAGACSSLASQHILAGAHDAKKPHDLYLTSCISVCYGVNRDCAFDPTCVLCVDCFKKSTHRSHKYRVRNTKLPFFLERPSRSTFVRHVLVLCCTCR